MVQDVLLRTTRFLDGIRQDGQVVTGIAREDAGDASDLFEAGFGVGQVECAGARGDFHQDGASAASAYHFFMPPLGVMFGWLLLGERVNLLDLAGIVPVALGIYLVTRSNVAPPSPTHRPAESPAISMLEPVPALPDSERQVGSKDFPAPLWQAEAAANRTRGSRQR